ncbi:MAG: hypothetical protein ACRBCS_15920 [Cellvibrionaceae bacterium]
MTSYEGTQHCSRCGDPFASREALYEKPHADPLVWGYSYFCVCTNFWFSTDEKPTDEEISKKLEWIAYSQSKVEQRDL